MNPVVVAIAIEVAGVLAGGRGHTAVKLQF